MVKRQIFQGKSMLARTAKIIKVDIEKVKKVEWKGDAELYDTELSRLGPRNRAFFVANPWVENGQYFNVKDVPPTTQCVVYKTKDNWIIKYFPPNWSIKHGYKEIEINLQNLEPEFEDDFSNWVSGFKSGSLLYQKVRSNERDIESKTALAKLCSKSVGEFIMHGALDALLYMKRNKNIEIKKLHNQSFLKSLFKEIYKQ